MRWFWIDRFIEFESGSYAKSVKNVTLAEEHLHDHFPGFPVMPGSLMIEGLAQTGGILLGEINDFEHVVIFGQSTKDDLSQLGLSGGPTDLHGKNHQCR